MVKYLTSLFRKVVQYETTDINGNNTPSRSRLCLSRLPYLLIAVACYILLFRAGFPESFISAYTNVLAVLIGLLLASLILCLERMYNSDKKSIEGRYEITVNDTQIRRQKRYIVGSEALRGDDSRANIPDTQQNNLAEQFACFTGYNIVLCTVSLFLILFVSLLDIDAYNPFNTHILDSEGGEWGYILNVFIGIFVTLERVFVLYAMCLIVRYTLLATISLVQIMTMRK